MKEKSFPKIFLFHSFLCIFLLILIYFPLLGGNYQLFWRDILTLYQPLFDFVYHSFQKGDFPFWNPLIATGIPLLAGAEPALFYPGNFLFWLVGYTRGLPWLLILHHLWAAWGTWLLCRSLKLNPSAAALGGLSFSLSGIMISMNNLSPLMFTASWIPWLFWGVRSAIEEPRLYKNWRVVLIYAMQILSGHLELVYIGSVWVIVYLLLQTFRKKIPLKKLAYLCALGILGIAIASIQLLPSLEMLRYSVRTLDIFSSQAQAWSAHPFSLLAFWVPNFYGNMFYTQNPGIIFGDKDFQNQLLFTSHYSGAILGILCLLYWSIFPHLEKEERFQGLFWSGSLFFFLIMALGKYLPVYQFFQHYMPGFSFLRYPVKFYIFISLVLAILAAKGFHALIEKQVPVKRLLKFSIIFSLLFIFPALVMKFNALKFSQIFWDSYHTALKEQGDLSIETLAQLIQYQGNQYLLTSLLLGIYALLAWVWQRNTQAAQLITSLFLLLLGGDLVSQGINQIWYVESSAVNIPSQIAQELQKRGLDKDPDSRFVTGQLEESTMPSGILPELNYSQILRTSIFAYQRLVDNLGTNYNFKNAQAYYPGQSQASEMFQYKYYTEALEKNIEFRNILETLWGVRYITTSLPPNHKIIRFMDSQKKRYLEVFSDLKTGLSIWENLNWQSRVHFKSNAYIVSNKEAAQQVLENYKETGFDPQKHVILEKDSAFEQALKEVSSKKAEKLIFSQPKIIQSSNNSLQIQFETNNSGYLILADHYFPGWKAHDNSKEIPILQANYYQRAVRVGPGKHLINFDFQPQSFQWGLLISCSASLLLFFWSLWEFSSDKKVKTAPSLLKNETVT